jgi:hypothetical protein
VPGGDLLLLLLLQVKYALPGMAGSLIELACNEDLDNMWDEWDEHIASNSSGSTRLQLFVDAAANSAHGSGSSSSSSSGGGHRRLQPQTPNSALGMAAAGAAASAGAQLAAGQSCSWDGSAVDAHVLVPVGSFEVAKQQQQQQAAQAQQWVGLHAAAEPDCHGVAAAVAVAGGDEEGLSSEQFATCCDMTAALESDPDVAAVLAAMAAEKAAGKAVTGEVQSSSSQQQQQQGDTELKQLVRQLKVRPVLQQRVLWPC